MNIGMLIWTYWPGPEGGAERQCRALVHELTRRGISCTVFTSWSSYGIRKMVNDDLVTIHRFGFLCPCANAFKRLFFLIAGLTRGLHEERFRAVAFWILLPLIWLSRLSFLLGLAIYAMRVSAPCNVLHVHESGWLAGVGVLLARRWCIPVICKESTFPALGSIGYDTPFRRKLEHCRYIANAWVAQTPYAMKELRMKGLLPDRIHLVPNGVTLPVQTADPTHAQGVLYVGNLTQGAVWKAFDILFDAWVRVVQARQNALLTVVGGGDPIPWIRTLRREGVESSVHFKGRIDDLSSVYGNTGIFVLPSRIEGLSNALIEAMSWGLPCVVSDIPGNRAVIDHGVNGLVVPVNDAVALAEAIVNLLNNPVLRSSLGSNARRKAESEYNIQHVTDKLINIYHKVLNENIGVKHKL